MYAQMHHSQSFPFSFLQNSFIFSRITSRSLGARASSGVFSQMKRLLVIPSHRADSNSSSVSSLSPKYAFALSASSVMRSTCVQG